MGAFKVARLLDVHPIYVWFVLFLQVGHKSATTDNKTAAAHGSSRKNILSEFNSAQTIFSILHLLEAIKCNHVGAYVLFKRWPLNNSKLGVRGLVHYLKGKRSPKSRIKQFTSRIFINN